MAVQSFFEMTLLTQHVFTPIWDRVRDLESVHSI